MNTPTICRLGCATWTCPEWIGAVFEAGIERRDLLRAYAKIFNTVEAASFFYSLPSPAQLEQWMAETGSDFRFVPTFPQSISHDRRLSGAEAETAAFLKILETLQHGQRLGPSILQLPPSFNTNSFDTLKAFLKSLPPDFQYAIEPNHITWFDKGENEQRLDDLLEGRGMSKAVFDKSHLLAWQRERAEPSAETDSQPQMPHRKTALGAFPVLRLAAGNDIEPDDPWIKEWAPVINKWILENKEPFLFVHCPNPARVPYVARHLAQQLRKLNPLLPALPEFHQNSAGRVASEQSQLDLFSS